MSNSIARRGLFGFLFALLVLAQTAPAAQSGLLLEGTKWQTAYHIIDSGEAGPTVVVVGGVHGNEPAGARAAEQIRAWPIKRGRLVIIPQANRPGLDAGTRFMPDEPNERRDLNRNFPRTDEEDEQLDGELAAALWRFISAQKPDWLLDLHEGYDFHQRNSDSVGSSVIHFASPDMNKLVDAMISKVNATIEDPQRKLVPLRKNGPVNGSLARAAAQRLKCHAMILETTFNHQRLPLRARQHRMMVHHVLTHLAMTDASVYQLVSKRGDGTGGAAGGPLRIALFDDSGVGGRGVPRLEAILGERGVVTRRLDAVDIRHGALEQFDAAIFSGGSGSAQAASLGENGRQRVKGFVEAGRGYVGICAGAYLATAGYTWSLKIIDAKTLHTGKEWRRGRGEVNIELTDAGRRVLSGENGAKRNGDDAQRNDEDAQRNGDDDAARNGDAGRVTVLYANGPIVGPAARDDIPDYRPLAFFRTEIADNGTPKGLMVNTPAILLGDYGRGRALIISPHPEQTESLESLVARAVEWAAGRN